MTNTPAATEPNLTSGSISWPGGPPVEDFTQAEARFLAPYVTNTDLPVFALRNLPEVVKGALFARYSRSSKSLRRLLLDEFRDDLSAEMDPRHFHNERAESLYERVFSEYGDDSIAQLGTVHLACEGVSNILTKVLERGRLMSYLEQSTRYIPYTDRPGGQWKYHIPADLNLDERTHFATAVDAAFEDYALMLEQMTGHLLAALPRTEGVSESAFKRAVRAKALDLLRGLLPAATRSNVGVFGSGQSYELLVMRLLASTNEEARTVGGLMLTELQKVIPSFVARVPREDRGVVWTNYFAEVKDEVEHLADEMTSGLIPEAVPEVSLVDFDPEGETKVVAAALYADSTLSDRQLHRLAETMSVDERLAVIRAYVGKRTNRRHRPGRAFERTGYRFDVLGDYGAFRDLQRHRLMSLDWQVLTTVHGYDTPPDINAAGLSERWHSAMSRASELHASILAAHPATTAAYAVPMAYRIRYYMDMNARQAMHLIELRSAEQGHDNYRRVASAMHTLIAEQAGHRAIAGAMQFVDHTDTGLQRLTSEAASEARQSTGSST